ncbi:MAG: hypothetical protein AAGA56_24245 [Myxococcota bacterium]
MTLAIDRSRFIALAASMAACHADHQAPADVPVADPLELTEVGAREPMRTNEVALDAQPSGPRGPDRGDLEARCRKLEPPPSSPSCESFDGSVQLCRTMMNQLDEAVLNTAIRCFESRNRTYRLCGDIGRQCFGEAVRRASPAYAAKRACAEVAKQCGSRRGGLVADQSNCERAVGAVSPTARERLLTCMSEGCDIRNCVWALRSPALES